MTSNRTFPTHKDAFSDYLLPQLAAGTENLSTWIHHLQSRNGLEALFEMEIWLRALQSFFDPKHLPLSECERAELAARNFREELKIAGCGLEHCERFCLEVMRLGHAGSLAFESFLERQLHKDSSHDYQIGKILEQPTPADSLSCLLDAVSDLQTCIDELTDAPLVRLKVYLSIGRLYRRSLRDCRFVDMLIAQRFRLQHDRIENPAVSAVLKSIAGQQQRRDIALALLHFFRYLKYLEYISKELKSDRALRHTLPIFSLLHDEGDKVTDLLRSRFLKGKGSSPRLRRFVTLVVHSLRLESKRILEIELARVAREEDSAVIYAHIENASGILRNCYQSCIISLLQSFDESIDPRTVFPSMMQSQKHSHRLRQDLWNLRQVLKDELGRRTECNLPGLLSHLAAFRESSLRHLMYRDWSEFERFPEALITASTDIELRTHLRRFISFLEILIQEVSKRSVLQ